MINPIENLIEKVNHLSNTLDKIVYWVNPINIAKETWKLIETNMHNGNWDVALIVMTVVVIWLTMLGAKRPKKYCFWTWVGYLMLRGFVFVK